MKSETGNPKYSDLIENALEDIRSGKFVLLYDSEKREGETDFVISAIKTQPEDVQKMRKDGGGLICVSIGPNEAEKLSLPYFADIVKNSDMGSEVKSIAEVEGDIAYDKKSSFSIWLNHRENRTGIPDNDRSLTIRKLGEMVKRVKEGKEAHIYDEFRTPGHTATLRAAKGLLNERRGQTELSIALAEMANITPAMVVCEMLDDYNGKALSKDDAIKYAKKEGFVFLEGKDVVEAYELFLEEKGEK
ncbi:MAG: 3,4-dihydroxy-2-butanone-4-phosphate synthase [Methanosarcinaceae archaeon]|nr:3,4-dihydroxy-2-butanone-4-phosphate synthase [Methanosarcinaceae archaeon]